jgi:hypothetical protein
VADGDDLRRLVDTAARRAPARVLALLAAEIDALIAAGVVEQWTDAVSVRERR